MLDWDQNKLLTYKDVLNHQFWKLKMSSFMFWDKNQVFSLFSSYVNISLIFPAIFKYFPPPSPGIHGPCNDDHGADDEVEQINKSSIEESSCGTVKTVWLVGVGESHQYCVSTALRLGFFIGYEIHKVVQWFLYWI